MRGRGAKVSGETLSFVLVPPGAPGMRLVVGVNSYTVMFAFLIEDICRNQTSIPSEVAKSRVRPVKEFKPQASAQKHKKQ